MKNDGQSRRGQYSRQSNGQSDGIKCSGSHPNCAKRHIFVNYQVIIIDNLINFRKENICIGSNGESDDINYFRSDQDGGRET